MADIFWWAGARKLAGPTLQRNPEFFSTMSPISAPPDDRRGFLAKCLALGFAATALAVPAFSALAAFFNPWRQKAAAGQWVRAASLAALPEGVPQRCPIIADRTDAWNAFPTEAIGAVFLCRG